MADNHSDNPKNEILVHLESIRNLLEKDRAAQQEAQNLEESARGGNKERGGDSARGDNKDPGGNDQAESADEQVPMLDDVIAGGLSLDESPLSERQVMEEVPGGLDDALFQALLGEAWKDSAATLLEASRADIERHRTRWKPEDTDALNDALRVRIDDTLRTWLREMLRRNLDDLRVVLLNAIEDQLKKEISRTLTHSSSGNPDSQTPTDDEYGK